ncbi:unnamed protein product [Oreochromis niloticus]|nr:unnamed protein product [Mustela putorius furo]
MLDDLGEKELERFHFYLQNQPVRHFPTIKKSRLENANGVKTVDVMIQSYSDDALEVARLIIMMVKNGRVPNSGLAQGSEVTQKLPHQAYPSGEGKTKKEAKQNAAKNALEGLSQLGHQDSVESRNNAAEASVQMVPSSEDTSCTETDFKSLVNRYCQKTKRSHSYVEVKKDGPSHIPHFFYKLIIDNKEYPVGDGNSIKIAQQKAAELACSALQEQPDWDSMVSIRPTASEDGAPPESLASSVTQESIESSSQGLTTDKSESVISEESSNPPTDQRNNAAEASVQMVPSSEDTSCTETDFKSLVNRYCQKTKRSHSYVEVKKDGPSHIPHFFYKLKIDNKEYPVGDGKTVKIAQQKAAELACSVLQEQPDWDSMVSIRPTTSKDGAPPESLASSVTQ